MSQKVTQNVTALVQVLLSKDNAGVTGLTDTDVTCQFSKNNSAFAAKILTGVFTEVGLGVYTISFSAADLDTVGPLTVVVTGATTDQSTTQVQVVAADETPTTVSLQTCTLTGHVAALDGQPLSGVAVSARVLGRPSVEQNAAVMDDGLVTATTDGNGQFFLTLVRLADVEVFIPAANFRRRIVVPNQASADLFEVP